MKNYASRTLRTVALFYLTFPLSYLVVTALLFDIPANLILKMILSPAYYILSFIAILAGFGLWEMKRWSWYVFLFSSILIGYYNAVLASDFGSSHHRVLGFIAITVTLLIVILRVSKELRVPYLLPKIRWWESDPRYRLSVPARIARAGDSGSTTFQGEILDLSMGGCFIKLKENLDSDSEIGVEFSLFGVTTQVNGNIVWKAEGAVTHPRGCGIKFHPLSRTQKRQFKAITQRLRKISHLYRSSRYLMNQEEFFKKLDELQNLKIEI